MDQIGQEHRQAIVEALQPMVLDRYILAFEVAGFIEAFAERGYKARGGIGRPGTDKPDHWQRRLLRLGGEWPRDRSAAKCKLKIPPCDVACHLTRTQWDGEEYHAPTGRSGQSRRLPSCCVMVANGDEAALRTRALNDAIDPWRRFAAVNCRIAKGLFDHLGGCEQRRRDCKAERFGGGE